jgi:hypothetical protein
LIETGSDLAEHGVVRFRLRDLCAWVEKRVDVTYHEQGLSKLIKRLGFRPISARPEHSRSDPERQAAFKKRQPKDQRHKAAYLFAAARPETNRSAALVLPMPILDAMTLHLADISTQVTPGVHAVVVLDRAGWHTAHDIDLPDNISLLFLPP